MKKANKRGFTLIELLAIIIIVGAIMVVAVMMVSNYITKSKQQGAIKSTYGYIDAVQKSAMSGDYSIDSYKGIYYFTGNKLEREDGFTFTVEGKNFDKFSGDLVIDDEGKVIESYCVLEEYEVVYDGSIASINGTTSQVNVRKIFVEDNVSVDIEGTYKMSFSIYPTNSKNVTVTWTSSNPDVVTVDDEGYLTPVSGGEAVITAKTSTGISDSAKVNIVMIPYTPGDTVTKATVFDFINSKKLSVSGVYTLELANGVTINTEVYVFNDDMVYTTTPVLCDNVVDTKMCIYKYKKDLKVNTGVTMTPQVRKKGFSLYVGGTLTNGGVISMTARGASAVGQDVLLYKNSNATYEMIPAVGATGGAKRQAPAGSTIAGYIGGAGTLRKTGGGGGGAGRSYNNTGFGGPGGSGTSYSGGAGGGGGAGTSAASRTGGTGSSTGGAGGVGNWMGGGAGNPGGGGSAAGGTGTGGLLNIFATNITNTGTISSNGSNGGTATSEYLTGGGASGGGSINIFYFGTYTSTGTIVANGGTGGSASSGSKGGNGGVGSITIGSVSTGSFVSN